MADFDSDFSICNSVIQLKNDGEFSSIAVYLQSKLSARLVTERHA